MPLLHLIFLTGVNALLLQSKYDIENQIHMNKSNNNNNNNKNDNNNSNNNNNTNNKLYCSHNFL